jgi:hypothetical protein
MPHIVAILKLVEQASQLRPTMMVHSICQVQ